MTTDTTPPADGKSAEALRKALELTKYAAAPFFPQPFRQGKQRTTPEWWDGLREQIELVQPLLIDALATQAQPATDRPAQPYAWLALAPPNETHASARAVAVQLRQPAPATRAIWEAEGLCVVPLYERPTDRPAPMMREYLSRIEQTLTIPAAEFVPAIGDVFDIIDEARKRLDGAALDGAPAPGTTGDPAAALAAVGRLIGPEGVKALDGAPAREPSDEDFDDICFVVTGRHLHPDERLLTFAFARAARAWPGSAK